MYSPFMSCIFFSSNDGSEQWDNSKSILFSDTKIPVTIQSLGYKNGDRVSISINGKEHSPNKPGINVVVMDFMTFQVTEAASFTLPMTRTLVNNSWSVLT